MTSARFFSLLLVSALALPSLLHAHDKSIGSTVVPSSGVVLSEIQPERAVHYRLTVHDSRGQKRWGQKPRGQKPVSQDWYFVRTTQRIALLKPQRDEAWIRDARGQIRFERAFHEEKRIVEYSEGELRSLEVTPTWSGLGAMLDPKVLASLQYVGAGKKDDQLANSRPANQIAKVTKHYHGKVAGELIDVVWIPTEQLPARIQRSKAGIVSVLELVTVEPKALADWPLPARTDGYARMDATDFGDMEYDPFVVKAEQVDVAGGWRAVHSH